MDPLFFISFDQRIDPARVLQKITVTADGQKVGIRLATQAEKVEDQTVKNLVMNAQESRYLVFRASEPLPADAEINVTVEAGTPSAEGPLVTAEAQSYSFYTYAQLKLVDHHCGWDDNCRPLMPLTIEFNNPLDPETFNEGLLEITPELPRRIDGCLREYGPDHGDDRGAHHLQGEGQQRD